MPESWSFSIRDLVPRPDPFERVGEEPDVHLHRAAQARLQRRYRRFQSEASLTARLEIAGREVTVTGRLDGYRRVRGGVLLYEIKPVPGDPKHWIGQPELQQARWQLELYADLARHARAVPWNDLPIVGAVLLLTGADGRIAEEVLDVSAGGILYRRLEAIFVRIDARRRLRSRSASELSAFVEADRAADRPEQQEAGRELEVPSEPPVPVLLSMPPGSGKTRIALRWGLRESFRRGRPLYWITTKTRGRDEVLRELERYADAGLPLRVLWKSSAERLCACGFSEDVCPRRLATRTDLFLDGLHDLHEQSSWSILDLSMFAADRSWCLREIVQELQPAADVVIADLNYVLQPSSLLRSQAVLVLDEAQNLGQRIFETSQVRISREDFLALSRDVPAALRRRIHDLLDMSRWEEEGSSAVRAEWLLLARQLAALGITTSSAEAIQRAARFWNEYDRDYVLRWYRGGPAFVGALVHAEAVVEKLLQRFEAVLALSGSLPAADTARAAVVPGVSAFRLVETGIAVAPPVSVVPLLDFRHPLTIEDHEQATVCLHELRSRYEPTIAVFGQNRASNDILAWRLRVRGYTVLLDEDLGGDWTAAAAARPDFLFIPMGGNLAEAVNPPPGLFSAAAILSPGHRAPDEFDLLRAYEHGADHESDRERGNVALTALAVSRVVQAAGRVQRSPRDYQPVFLLNRAFARPEYLAAWPRTWYAASPRELVFDSLTAAMDSLSPQSHAH